MNFDLQGENDKHDKATEHVEETEAEKYKRARKLYSLRMQAKIKKRLSQDHSGEQSGNRQEQVTTPNRVVQAPVRPQPPVQPRRPAANVQANAETTHSVFYDVIIAVIVVIIAILLFRRFSMLSVSDANPASSSASPPQPPANEDLL